MSTLFYIAPIFFIIALVYATIGQGGASAYLAVLVLFGMQYETIPSVALACNIVATAGIVYRFRKAGFLKTRLVLPFIITSIPAAFIGGTIKIPENVFEIILIVVLFAISLRLFFWKADDEKIKRPSIAKTYLLGGLIGLILGLLAGLIGIGGGILLTPIIIFLRWGKVKEAAVAGGLFTFVNSIAGLVGHGVTGTVDYGLLIPLLVIVIIGSQIGAHLGSVRLKAAVIQKVLAVAMFIIALRLLVSIF